MDKKKIIVVVAVIAVLCGGFFVYNGNKQSDDEQSLETQKTSVQKGFGSKKSGTKTKKNTSIKNAGQELSEPEKDEQKDNVKHGNLFNSSPSGYVPFSAIAELSVLPANVQTGINKVIDSYGGILMLKRTKDKIVIVAENPENIRHGIDFIEITVPGGHQTVTTLGYNGKIKDADNDNWEYDKNQLPVKHIKYNSEGDAEYIETWNYDASNPVKYEMKNAEGKTLSIRKETLKDGTDMRIEHLIYDTAGNTKVNVSTTYDGADVKRFTYYNADKPLDSESVFSEYSDGVKIKETVYTSDLKVKNVYEAKYEDGERVEISVYDNNNKEIENIKAEE